MDAQRLVGLLAEPDRRAVVAAMILGATETSDIADTAGIDLRAAVAALGRLTDGGLVETVGSQHHLLAEAFKLAARSGAPTRTPAEFPGRADDESRVLDAAFRDGRLVELPTKRSKRLVVLDHLAQRFEPGRRYTERQVNAVISVVHPDTAALRRYLVDERFLDRADGEYWRSGGSVLLDDA